MAPPWLPVESWPLVASSVMDPLLSSERPVNVASASASAVIINVPFRLAGRPGGQPERHRLVERGRQVAVGVQGIDHHRERSAHGDAPGRTADDCQRRHGRRRHDARQRRHRGQRPRRELQRRSAPAVSSSRSLNVAIPSCTVTFVVPSSVPEPVASDAVTCVLLTSLVIKLPYLSSSLNHDPAGQWGSRDHRGKRTPPRCATELRRLR